MNPNVLISTAMISSIWRKQRKDSLDIMLPFLKYAVAKETSVGQAVDIEKVLSVFKCEFGYDSIPRNVIITMLNRLSPNILTRSHGRYMLNVTLDDELKKFEKQRTLFKEHREQVGSALASYLNEHVFSLSTQFDSVSALSALTGFFVINGLIVAQSPEHLSLLKKDVAGKINYCIARFLVEEHKKIPHYSIMSWIW